VPPTEISTVLEGAAKARAREPILSRNAKGSRRKLALFRGN